MEKIKILWLTNIPSPYRVEFFNQLGEKSELTVLFERKTSDERDDSWADFHIDNFRAVFLNGKNRGVDNAICIDVIRYLKRNRYDYIVVTNYSDITGMLAVIYLKIMHIPYWVEGDGAYVNSGKGIKEKLKKFLLKNAIGYFSTCNQHDLYYYKYGAKKEEIFRYPFSSIKEKDIIRNIVSDEQKRRIRERLGIDNNKFVVLYVGRFIEIKGIDVIIQSFNSLQNKRNDIQFLLVGGELNSELSEMIENEYRNNIFIFDFLQGDDLENVYKCSDIFLFPSRGDVWGLVVNEAIAHGLPVITTNRCNAGLELIQDGKNGYITQVDDVDAIVSSVEKIIDLLKNNNDSIKQYSFDKAKEYTIEKMVEKHLTVLKKDN